MKIPTELESAWLAGLIDGEGFVGLSYLKKKDDPIRYYVPRIKVHMTHEETIRKLGEFCGNVYENKAQKNCNQAWAWECGSADTLTILKLIQPFSVTKKRNIDLLIRFIEIREAIPRLKRKDNPVLHAIADEIRSLTASTRQLRRGAA